MNLALRPHSRALQVKIELAAAQAGNASAGPSSHNSASSMKRHGSGRSPLENGRHGDHSFEGDEVEELTREPNADLPTVGIRKSPDSLAGQARNGINLLPVAGLLAALVIF